MRLTLESGVIQGRDLTEGSLIRRGQSRDEGHIEQVGFRSWLRGEREKPPFLKRGPFEVPSDHDNKARAKAVERSLPLSEGKVKAACALS